MAIGRLSFKERMEQYKLQTNQLPKIISLIWIGDDIPNSIDNPVLGNAFKHKEACPDAIVQIFVDKRKLEASGKCEGLFNQCSAKGIVLRDITTECREYLNYDIIVKLMENKKDYVWASDLLRLSVIYHEGGEYYDVDIQPNPWVIKGDSEPLQPIYGFLVYIPSGKGTDPSYLAGTQNHFFYLYSAVISRYLYERAQEEIRKNPEWISNKSWRIRHHVICCLSGRSISLLLRKTSLRYLCNYSPNTFLNRDQRAKAKSSSGVVESKEQKLISWNKGIDRRVHPELFSGPPDKWEHPPYWVNHICSWLEGFDGSRHGAPNAEELRINAEFDEFYQRQVSNIQEEFLQEQESKYFNKDKHYAAGATVDQYAGRPYKITSSLIIGGGLGCAIGYPYATTLTAYGVSATLFISASFVLGAVGVLILAYGLNRYITGHPGFFGSRPAQPPSSNHRDALRVSDSQHRGRSVVSG